MAIESEKVEMYSAISKLVEPVQIRIELRNLFDIYYDLKNFVDSIMHQPFSYLARPGLKSLKFATTVSANHIREHALSLEGLNICNIIYGHILQCIDAI